MFQYLCAPQAAWSSPLPGSPKKLTKTELNFYTFDRELLAAFSGIKDFRSCLEGRPFQLWTNHKLLLSALTRVSPLSSGHQQRHLAFILEFTNFLVYIQGVSNVGRCMVPPNLR